MDQIIVIENKFCHLTLPSHIFSTVVAFDWQMLIHQCML